MRLSFPEAEVTRSLSSNLLKWGVTNLQQEEKRIIDTNELLKRREDTSGHLQAAEHPAVPGDGFTEGLHGTEVETGSEEGLSGNVIKAGEDAETLRVRAQEEAERLVGEARAEAEQILEQARSEAQKETEHTLEQARQQGYEEGMNRARQEAEQGQRDLAARGQALEEEYRKQLDEVEPRLVEAITEVYQHIFHVDLGSYKEILFYLISSTMRRAEGSREFLVHVSKEDYPEVLEHKGQLGAGVISSNASVEVIEDISLAENQCMIETEGGIFDCGLGTQLAELKQKLRLLSYDGT